MVTPRIVIVHLAARVFSSIKHQVCNRRCHEFSDARLLPFHPTPLHMSEVNSAGEQFQAWKYLGLGISISLRQYRSPGWHPALRSNRHSYRHVGYVTRHMMRILSKTKWSKGDMDKRTASTPRETVYSWQAQGMEARNRNAHPSRYCTVATVQREPPPECKQTHHKRSREDRGRRRITLRYYSIGVARRSILLLAKRVKKH